MAANVLKIQQLWPNKVLVFHMIPSVDKLLLVNEFRFDEVREGKSSLKIDLFLCLWLTFIGDLDAKVAIFEAASAKINFE